MDRRQIRIPSDPAELRCVRATVAEWARRAGFSPATADELAAAVHEAVVNAMEHGNRYNPARWVSVYLEESDLALTVTVQDEGPGVRLAEAPVDPLADRGRGLELMRGLVDEVRTSADVGRTVLVKAKASE